MSKYIYSQRSFLAGVVPSYSLGDPEDPKRQHALGSAQNMIVTQKGALTRAPGSLYGFTLPDETQPARLVPFETADAKFLLVFQPGVIHFYKDVNGTFTRITPRPWHFASWLEGNASTPLNSGSVATRLYGELGHVEWTTDASFRVQTPPRDLPWSHGMGPVQFSATDITTLSTGTDYWLYVGSCPAQSAERTRLSSSPTNFSISTVLANRNAFETPNAVDIGFATSKANLDAVNLVGLTFYMAGSFPTLSLTMQLSTASGYYEIPTPYSAADLELLQFDRSGDQLIISTGTQPAMVLSKCRATSPYETLGDDSWHLETLYNSDGPFAHSESYDSSVGAAPVIEGGTVPTTYPILLLGEADVISFWETGAADWSGYEDSPIMTTPKDAIVLVSLSSITGSDTWYAFQSFTEWKPGYASWLPTYCLRVPRGQWAVGTYPTKPSADAMWFGRIYGLGNGWPVACVYYGGRAYVGGGGIRPWQVHGSSLSSSTTFLPFEYDTMTVTANTALSLDPFRDTNVDIVSIGSLDELIVASDDAVWAFGPTDYSTAMAATNVTAIRISDVGAARTNMAATRNALAYISADRRRVFLIRSLAKTGVRGYDYKTLDLTDDWPTLFSGDNKQAKRIVFQTKPEPVIWVQRDDGTMASCSIDPERGMKAWTEHTTDAVEDLAVMTSDDGSYQAVYRLMNRTINGGTHRYVEYQRSNRDGWNGTLDSVFTESSVEYSGVAITVVTGLGHLEGETVYVRKGTNGGIGQESHTVTSGQITLTSAQTEFVLGLVRYGAWIYHEPIVQFPNGWSSGSMLMLRELRMQVASSRDGSYWPNGDISNSTNIDYPIERSTSPIYTGWVSVRPDTDGLDASRNAWITGETLPFTIAGVVMVVEATEAFGQR